LLSKILQIAKSLFKNSDNRIEQNGSNNLAFQGISNSTLTVIKISDPHYENWKHQLETERKYYARLEENEIEERIRVSKNISILEKQISEYEKQVLLLAEEIKRKNYLKSYRLERVKELIEQGKISEAREFYRSKLAEIQKDENDSSYDRSQLAEEYLILAFLTQTDYYNPNLFDETLKYFKRSVEINENQVNLFSYAHFLDKYNRFSEAKRHYENALEKYEKNLDLSERAIVHSNLGNVYSSNYEFDKAEDHFNQSLAIIRRLMDENPSSYSKDYASTLHNLAHLHTLRGEVDKAALEYEKVLKIRQQLFEDGDDYQKFHIADVLMNLGTLNSDLAQQRNDNEKFKKATDYLLQALKIYKERTKDKNTVILHVAMCLGNLALVYQRREMLKKAYKMAEESNVQYRKILKADPAYFPAYAHSLVLLGGIKSLLRNNSAIEDFHEALEIQENLEKISPRAFLPDIGITLNNIAIYYQNIMYREESIAYAVESIVVILPFLDLKPRLKRYYNLSIKVLKNWNLSDDDINSLIQEKIKLQNN
jgi:tetratricopeptide (TPR) repeat protein